MIGRLRSVIDELASEDIVGLPQRDAVAQLWRELTRLDAQLARRVGELDRSMEWSVDGSRSAASWLVAHARAATGDAHRRVNVARQTACMPIAAAAWAAGEISSRHVDALTTVRNAASADAEFAVFEPALVDIARTGRPEDVASMGRRWRDALDTHRDRDGSQSISGQEHERRGVHFSRSLEGIGVLDGTFDVEGAEIIDAALQHAYDRAHTAGDPRTPAQQRADAMVEIFRRYNTGRPRGTNRPNILLIADAATYADETVGVCETASGSPLSPETLRRLACDAIIQRAVVDADGVVLDLGRATRTFTPDQYRAMVVRDGGCRWPLCEAPADDCEAHHARRWADGGATDLGNGYLACNRAGHHRNLHEGGYTVTGNPNGELTFHDPNGNVIGTSRPRRPPPPIPTRTGNEIDLARQRTQELRDRRPAA